MNKVLFKRFIVGAALLIMVVPQLTMAQSVPGFSSSVPVSDSRLHFDLTGQKPSATDTIDSLAKLGSAAADLINEFETIKCITAKAQGALDKVDQANLASGGQSLLSFPEASSIKAKIIVLEGTKGCLDGQVKKVKDSMKTNKVVIQQQRLQALLDDYTKQKSTVELRLDELNAQFRIAERGFWKAVLIKLLLTNTQRISQNLVQDLTEKFKINDYLGYANALAGTVYTNRLIATTVGGNANQMVIRSLITNPLVTGQLHPQAQAAAAGYVAANSQNLAFTDANYYESLAKLGDCQAFSWCMTDQWNQQAAQIRSQAQNMSLQEIAQGQGYKSPLTNCSTNLAQQQAIDKQYQALLAEYKDRRKLVDYYDDPNISEVDREVSAVDDARSRADLAAAQAKLEAFPYQFNQVALNICEGITSPASKFNFAINDLIGTQISHLKDYNDNNLPEVVKLVSGISDTLIQKYLFGKNISTSHLLQEGAGLAAGAFVPGGTGSGVSPLLATSFYFERQDNFGTYRLYWDYSIMKDRNKADYVKISGPGITSVDANKQWPLTVTASGGPKVVIQKDELYETKIYTAANQLVVTDSINITNVFIDTTSGSGNGTGGTQALLDRNGHVAGVNTVSLRGPQVQISPSYSALAPRGPQ
jgi:hypothetical protein